MMMAVSTRLDTGPWITVKYLDSEDRVRDHTLNGKKVGYKSNEENNGVFRIYGDKKTFGVPLHRLLEFKMDDRGED